MIGTATDFIVSGYSFPSYATDNVQLKPTADAVTDFQQKAAAALVALKKEQRVTKGTLEIAKNKEMASSSSEKEKHDYLFKEYVPALRAIGVSLERAKAAIQPALTALTQKLGQNRIRSTQAGDTWCIQMRMQATNDAKLWNILVFFKGKDGYESFDKGTPREVWRKKLGLLGGSEYKKDEDNQYVQDDRGVFTRRYAYAAKGLADAALLYKKEALTGRFQRSGKGTLDVTNDLKSLYPELAGSTKLTPEQMMFVHQELGSGDQQRGVCLSSTPKVVHGNRGGMFLNEGSVLFKVDLAKVPLNEKLLYNLYSQEAQEKTVGLQTERTVRTGSTVRTETYTAEQSKQHTDTSTAKNREIYLRELQWEYVVNQGEVERTLLDAGQIKISKPDSDGFTTVGASVKSFKKR